MGIEPEMTCHSKICGETFEKRHFKCPKCGTPGVAMLFKHRPINDYFWPLLEDGEIWCPSAHSLNDPYEFDFRLLVSSIDGHRIIQSELEEAKAVMKNYGVISFVEICDSIQMWAYYSDAHKGVCLGFERNEGNNLGNWEYCLPVLYHPDNELPAVMPLDLCKPETVAKIITTKSNEWSHEQEWRVLTRESDKAIPYPGRLVRVVFGIDTDPDHRERIMQILGDTVDYYQARKCKRYFVLDIEPLAAAYPNARPEPPIRWESS